MGTPPSSESIPRSYLIKEFRILLTKCKNYSQASLVLAREILSFYGGVFSSEAVAQAFIYLCMREPATTAWLLQVQLGLPEATAYRVLKRLRSLGLVEPIIKLPKRQLKLSGPIPKIWGLVDNYTQKDLACCINLHYRTLSPKYRLAVEIAQTMLDNYIKPRQIQEVSYREILHYIAEIQIPFMKPDIADLAAQYLHEQGVKVWR